MAPLVFACFVLRSTERYSNYNKWHSSVKPLGVLSYRYFVNIIWHWNLFRHFFTTFDKLLIRFVFQNSALLKQLRTYAQHVNDVFLLSPIHTTPGKLVNGVNDMLSVHVTLHVTPEKFKFRFVFLENSRWGRKGLRWCGFPLFLMRFCGNFHFNSRYCGFKALSGLRLLQPLTRGFRLK